MVMVSLSGLLRTPSHNAAPRPSLQHASAPPGSDHSSPALEPPREPLERPYIYEEEDLRPLNSEDPELRELNNSVAALAEILPDVQVEVFREMLSSFDEESRLAVVTEALLKSKMKWVRGRYRVAAGKEAQGERDKAAQTVSQVPVWAEEKFRSADYKKAVKATVPRIQRAFSIHNQRPSGRT